MSAGNISNPGEVFVPSISSTAPPVAPPITATPAGVADSPTTLSPSQEQQEADAANATQPSLPPPVSFQINNFQGMTGAEIMALGESKAILNMLSAWRESINEAADEQRKKDMDPDTIRKQINDPVMGNVLTAFLHASTNSTPDAKPGIEGPAISSVNKAAGPDSMADIIPLMTVGLIFAGAGGVKDSMMIDTLSTSMVAVNPSSNQAPPIALYTSDMRAELGLLGAAMMQGAAYVANATSIEKGDGAKINPEQTATKYAKEIIKLVDSGVITSLVTSILTQKGENAAPADPTMVKTLSEQLTAILLATALAGLYKSAHEGGTGWISGSEFDALLTGENKTFGKNQADMDNILKRMNTLFAGMDGKQAEIIKNYLFDFFEGNPSLSMLTDPAKVFAQILPSIKRNLNENPA